MQEKGWKAIGKGQLRLLCTDGVHFLEFRPLVSESAGSQEPEEEMVAGKVRFGRPVLSATLRKETKFDVNGKSVQVNLMSVDAAKNPVYARYNLPLGSDAKAGEFVAIANQCKPAA